jgi:hypothetical protein
MTGRTLTTGRPRTHADWLRLALQARQRGIEVRQLRDGVFVASSASNPDRAYEVSIGPTGETHCECQAASFGNLCTHVAALAVKLGRISLPEQDQAGTLTLPGPVDEAADG